MNARKRILPALIVSVFAAAAVTPAAEAVQFSRVVVFGDSLSDAGYFRPFLTSLGLPAPVVAQLGRFTTNPGPVWSELVVSASNFRHRSVSSASTRCLRSFSKSSSWSRYSTVSARTSVGG